MTRMTMPTLLCTGLVVAVATSFGRSNAPADNRVFELRTYHAAPGKMKQLHSRFRDYTCELFKKHRMEVVGFWSPQKNEDADSTLIYMLAFPSKEAAQKSWDDFRNDPEWKSVHAESEKEGKLVAKIESVYLNPTDYSPLK